MTAEPGPSFRWGLVLRRSQYNRRLAVNGEVERYEESTSRQELDLIQHIRANDMGIIAQTYTDIASAYKRDAKRPEFQNALDDLKAGRIDGIAVWKLDRLARRMTETYRVIRALEESGGRLFSLKDQLDTADDADKQRINLMINFVSMAAQMESEAHSVRTLAWHQQRAERGFVQKSRYRPFGHANKDWTSLVDDEVKLIHEAKERIFRGESATSIARDWTARGIPTRSGSPWHEDTIINFLTSHRMIGQRLSPYGLRDAQDALPIFTDREEWERLRVTINANRRQLGRKEWHLCSNIAACSLCNRPLIGAQSGDGVPSYGCRKRRKEPGACGRIYIAKKYLDEIVTREAIAFLSDRNRVMAVLRSQENSADMAAIHARYDELESDKLALERAAFRPPQGVPRLPTERYWSLRAEIEEEEEELLRRMAVNREAGDLKEALDFGDDAAEVWAERGVNYQRRMLKLIVKRIEVRPGRVIRTKGKSGNSFDPERVSITFADKE
jgi:site-specific DNA recombinase